MDSKDSSVPEVAIEAGRRPQAGGAGTPPRSPAPGSVRGVCAFNHVFREPRGLGGAGCGVRPGVSVPSTSGVRVVVKHPCAPVGVYIHLLL